MTEPERRDSLTEQLRSALDEHTANLDPTLLQRLDAARDHALASLNTRPAVSTTRWQQRWSEWLNRYTLIPAGGLAAAALVAMVWLNTMPTPAHPGIQDFELLSADASLDLLEELEFAEWLLFAEEEEGAHVSG